MPWVHLHVDTKGMAKACCEANIPFGNINKQSIDEIWQGEAIRKFRKSLMAGERDNRCAACFQKEDAGKQSMRTETLAKYEDKIQWVNGTDESGESPDSKPVYFDIRFNNLCNLRCRTCWHGASSSWFDEAKQLKQNFGSKAIIEATKDPKALIEDVVSQGVAIEEVYFAGGEPLMMDAHYHLLDTLIQNQQTEVHLRYNTNLSLLSLKGRNVVDLWKHFNKVTVSASIDAMAQQGEYVRKGLDWEKFLSNMKMIRQQLPHVRLEIAPTISVFNVLKLGELHRFFVDEQLTEVNAIYLNVLSRPDYFNIKVLPKELKMEASQILNQHIQWLRQKGVSEVLISEFESVIEYMNQDSWEHLLPKLKQQLRLLDEMRAENYEDVFPALKQVLDRV